MSSEVLRAHPSFAGDAAEAGLSGKFTVSSGASQTKNGLNISDLTFPFKKPKKRRLSSR